MFIDAGLVCLSLVLAAAPGDVPTVDEVRVQTRALLQTLCGAQCDVIRVEIKTRRAAPIGAVAPGFDDTPAARQVPASIDLELLLDKNLPAEFRTFVTDRVRHRIGEIGLPVTVAQTVRAFPELPAPKDEPPAAPPPASEDSRGAPIIVQAPAPQPALPAPLERPDPGDALVLRLIESLPLLLLGLLLAMMVYFVLRRFEALAALQFAPEVDEPAAKNADAPHASEVAAPGVPATSPAPPSVESLVARLRENRAGTRRVFRGLVMRGEYETVARAVSTFGGFALRDLAADPDVRPALSALGRRTAELLREPIAEDERGEVLHRIEAELIGDQVAHGAARIRPDLEDLLGFGPEAFTALVRRLDERLAVVLLRHAPQHLTEAYLSGLDARARTEAAEHLLLAPPASPEELKTLGEAVAVEADAALVDGEEAERVVDLIDAMPASEQDGLLAALEAARPDFVRRHLGRLPVESSLLRVPEYAIAAAWANVALEDWIAYLRAAPEGIRARSIAACPARLRDGLDEELRLRVAADPRRAAEARRKIVRAALHAAPAAGGNGAAGHAKAVNRDGQKPAGDRGPEEVQS